MPIRRPEKGEYPRVWDVLRDENWDRFNGWKVGELVTMECHWWGVSKPCLNILSGGKVQCPWHEAEGEIKWVGWVPIIREDGKGKIAVIQHYAFDCVDAIPVFSPCQVYRPAGRYESVQLAPWMRGQKYQEARGPVRAPFDLAPFLWRTILQRGDMLSWYQCWCRSAKSDNALSQPQTEQPAVATSDTGERSLRDLLAKRAKDEAARDERAGLLADSIGQVLRHPEKNGKHPPGKK